MSERRVRAFVESLPRNRRPKRFEAKPGDVDEMRAAIELTSSRPGATLPNSEFVNDLHRTLAEQLDNETSTPANVTALRRRAVSGEFSAVAAAAAAGVIVDRDLLHSSAAPKVATSEELVPDEGVWEP